VHALIVIGELVKKIDKITGQSLLKNYPVIPWGEIKGIVILLTLIFLTIFTY